MHPVALNNAAKYSTIKNRMIKVFVVHYKKLTDRKIHILNQLKLHNITSCEFIEIDRDELACENMQAFEPNFSNSQIAIALSHFYAYNQIMKHYDYALILEDDAILSPNFTDRFKQYLFELSSDFDMLFIGNGCNLHISPDKLIPNQHIYKTGTSRCTDSYVVSKKCATQICKYIATLNHSINIPIDWWLNDAARDNNFNMYWTEPTIVTQGTQNGTFQSSH